MKRTVQAPSSKSMTQRALLIAALAEGTTIIERPLRCDDSRYLSGLLEILGCTVSWQADQVTVTPGPLVAPEAPVFCGNAGTAVRFGSCLSLLTDGPLSIDGDEHMRTRPIGALADGLSQLGVVVHYLAKHGCPPLCLQREGAAPPSVIVDTSLSSQYASGLAMVGARLPAGLRIELSGKAVSMPYLHMTTAMMEAAGGQVAWQGERTIVVEPGGYTSTGEVRKLGIETDWSGAAFLIVAGRLAEVELSIEGLADASASLQGDAVFASMLRQLDEGCALFDLTDAPDLIAPLTAACLFAARPVKIRGAAHTRIKECDRVLVLSQELSKLGATVVAHDDGLDITPLTATDCAPVCLDPHDDHRMAMTFGILSLRLPQIAISSRDCISKSFPDFWQVLEQIRESPRSAPLLSP